jgi:Protein of unknown function (DUF3761)
MTSSTGSRWNPRRLLAVLATLSALLIGSTGCQYGATTGLASPQVSTQDGTSASPAPDPTPLVVPPPDLPALAVPPPLVVPPPDPPALVVPPPAPVLVQAPPAAVGPPAAGLCDADYYRNSNGNCVHRPEQAPAPPDGATAKCADGEYSFSQHRQGTCSGHGGVAQWLSLAVPPPAPPALVIPPPAPVLVQAPPAAVGPPAAGLCDADYYRNSNGNCVHRPEQAPAPPAGATAKCADGEYSFSQHRQGTCSGHGGVAQWL